jgi:predicted AlkP superfamily phosphohydrolase/phosphomutase
VTFRRVIVLGLDGLHPPLVESLLSQGRLPNLARLREQGGYARIATTAPAQTPVAWSTFATGVNPGGHGIFDFLRRDPDTYLPDLGLNRYEQKSAFLPPKVVNLRRGEAVWDVLAAAGVASTVLRCPCTYPPDATRGRMLSGMGVPDIRGGLGTSTWYTTEPGVTVRESEQVVELRGGAPSFRTQVIGPRNPKTRGDVTADVTLHVDRASDGVRVESDGEPRSLLARRGVWSPWLRLKFRSGMLQKTAGMVRFLVVRLEPHVEVYASPVNFDPAAPPFPISHPWEYGNELSQRLGLFYTTGMVEDHTGLSNERFDEGAFLAQCEEVMAEREGMLQFELDRLGDGFLFCLFDTPDRVQHMLWRFREPSHPANRRGAGDMAAYAGEIERHYERCDRAVGEVLGRADERTLVTVLSDHGFGSFQRGVHLNGWLAANGYLALRAGVVPGEEAGEFFRQVDWDRTRAYALGLGSVYLNVRGREAQGVVPAEDADGVAAEVAARLAGLRDDVRGTVAIRGARTRSQLYRGPYASESPDVVVDFAAGYRVSWTTALGGVPDGLFEDNVRKWGGDHIVDPALVPGVLFMNRPFDVTGPTLADLAPTILSALGAPRGAAMEGRTLLP